MLEEKTSDVLQTKILRRDFLKSLATLGLIGSTSGLLSACLPAQTPIVSRGEEIPKNTSGGEIHGAISFMVSGTPVEEGIYRSLAERFQGQQPGVEVTVTNIPTGNAYRKQLAMDMAAGTPSDVFIINYRRQVEYTSQRVLEPLGPYLEASSQIQHNDFFEKALAAFSWQGVVNCIPQNIASSVVYYNKTLFDQHEVPYPSDSWNWEEFAQTAKALTKDTDGDGQIDQWGMGSEAGAIRLAPFIWMNGGDLVDNVEEPTRLTLDTPETRAALEWFMSLSNELQVVPDATSKLHRDRFIEGSLAMFIDSRRETPSFRLVDHFDWDVVPLPTPPGKAKVNVLHSDAFSMAAASKDKRAAWAFIEYANAQLGQSYLAESGRTVPSHKGVAQSPAFLDARVRPERSHVFLDAIPTIRALPLTKTWGDIETAINREMEAAFRGASTLDAAIDGAVGRTLQYFKVRSPSS